MHKKNKYTQIDKNLNFFKLTLYNAKEIKYNNTTEIKLKEVKIMKSMKKIVAIILAVLTVCVGFAACSGAKDDTKKAQTDSEKIVANGKLVVGITDFAPMDYKEEGKDEWIGFDADMAKAFAKSLGVEVEFVEIDWDNKVLELQNGTIDCVWNGMTLTDEVKAAMECSKAYCNNAQVVIVNKDAADKYQSVEACKELNFAVEAGSAGEEQAKANGFNFTPVKDQATALTEVKNGSCNAAIIDSLMAAAMVGEGTGFADLTYTIGLNSEEYGVGFRKDSDMAQKLNDFIDASMKDGSMEKCAEQYGVQASLIK